MKTVTTTCRRPSGCCSVITSPPSPAPVRWSGPTLAAQFGFAPGFLWILIGAVLCGCVHDFTVLVASVRHKGRSLADVARTEVGPYAGLVTMIALLFILLVTLAGLGIVVVNALANSPWGVFTIGMTIPIAILHGPVHVQERSWPDQDRRAQHCWRGSADRRRHRRHACSPTPPTRTLSPSAAIRSSFT